MYISIYVYIHTYMYTGEVHDRDDAEEVLWRRGSIDITTTASFHEFMFVFFGIDSGNLKFETVRTHKQHICFQDLTLNLKFCDLKL